MECAVNQVLYINCSVVNLYGVCVYICACVCACLCVDYGLDTVKSYAYSLWALMIATRVAELQIGSSIKHCIFNVWLPIGLPTSGSSEVCVLCNL